MTPATILSSPPSGSLGSRASGTVALDGTRAATLGGIAWAEMVAPASL